MSKYDVFITPTGQEQRETVRRAAKAIDTAAADEFDRELATALEAIRKDPGVGIVYSEIATRQTVRYLEFLDSYSVLYVVYGTQIVVVGVIIGTPR